MDALIASLAETQHGPVARWQLLALGVGHGAIGHRVAAARLHPIHRGVHAVAHRVLSRPGWWMAGYRVVRITSRQLDRDATTIARQLRMLLADA